MNSLIIVYEIGHSGLPNVNYQPLYDAIRAYGTWARIADSCCAIRTEQTAVQVRDALYKYFGRNCFRRPYLSGWQMRLRGCFRGTAVFI